VVNAVAQGQQAAQSIAQYLQENQDNISQ